MEEYTHQQAENEAEAIKTRLGKDFPDQNGNFTHEQYQQAEKQEAKEIYKTAMGTVRDLAFYTDIKGAEQIWRLLSGEEKDENFSKKTKGKPHLVELRYKMSDQIIRSLAETEGVGQAVEIASGFTPHALELLGGGVLSNYIESDLLVNTVKKQELYDEVGQGLPVIYVPGNIYEKETWDEIEVKLADGPVVIFSEGFMLYSTAQERDKLANLVRPILQKHGGYFVFEDSTRFHPEFIEYPNFRPFFDKLAKSSQRDMGAVSQEDMAKEWEDRGFKIERVPENIPLSSESKLPDLADEITLIKDNYKMWKLSLRQTSK